MKIDHFVHEILIYLTYDLIIINPNTVLFVVTWFKSKVNAKSLSKNNDLYIIGLRSILFVYKSNNNIGLLGCNNINDG